MNINNRGTGRTYRMLQNVVDSPAQDVWVVGHSYLFIHSYLIPETIQMLNGNISRRTTNEITRSDGRKIHFASKETINTKYTSSDPVFWDHHAEELEFEKN